MGAQQGDSEQPERLNTLGVRSLRDECGLPQELGVRARRGKMAGWVKTQTQTAPVSAAQTAHKTDLSSVQFCFDPHK